jgi:hypothetical protein
LYRVTIGGFDTRDLGAGTIIADGIPILHRDLVGRAHNAYLQIVTDVRKP